MSGTRTTWVVGGCLLLFACGADDGGTGFGSDTPPWADGGTAFDGGGGTGPDLGDVGDGGLPSETEERRGFDVPRGGARHVYVPNPERDTVAVIDSESLRIATVDAGDEPTYLDTLPGVDAAVVLNVGSDDATILRTVDGESRTVRLDTIPGANAVAVAPDGGHALAYFDARLRGGEASIGNLQEVTVLSLEEGAEASLDLSVGFRPSDVHFAQDGSAAFVVTEDGVSVIRFAELTGATIAAPVSLGDSATDPLSRDVTVTPDGAYALARREGESVIRRVDLATGAIASLDLGSPVTDLDVAPSGDFALAALREVATVARIPLPDGFDGSPVEPTVITDEIVGSVDIGPDGRFALAYTTAAPVERVTILTLDGSDPPRIVRLRKKVRAAAISPTGGAALVVHYKDPGDPNEPGIDLDTQIDRSYGYTLLDLESGFAKLERTPADVGPMALTPDGTHAFLLLRGDPPPRELHRISLETFLVDTHWTGSPALSVGILGPAGRAFVNQDHPEGRLTFIDWMTGETSLVTGFELNSRIVE